tara:strand:- start:61195 stop:61518 length:324 start_codon:yes stop_codon:yes gene_type:complete
MAMRKIKIDDEVMVLVGRDKGKRGKVLRMVPEKNRVVVQGINMAKKHQSADQDNPQGGIIEKELSVHISNVCCIDPKTGEPTRVGFKTIGKSQKVRFAKRSGEVIDV